MIERTIWSPPFVTAILISILGSIPARSQTVVPKNVRSVILTTSAGKAKSQGIAKSSVTLAALITRPAGLDVETGPPALEVPRSAGSRTNLSLTKGQQTGTIQQSQGVPVGQYSVSEDTVRPMARPKCLSPASWFFPALTPGAALSSASIAIAYIGLGTTRGGSGLRAQFLGVVPPSNATPAAVALVQGLSTADAHLDASRTYWCAEFQRAPGQEEA